MFKTIRIHQGEASKLFWFTIHATNGRTLATSETYPKKRSAIKGAHSLFRSLGVSKFYWDEKIQDLTIPKTKTKKTDAE